MSACALRLLTALMVLATMVAPATTVFAQTAQCARLTAQLASSGRDGSAGQYAAAVRQQQRHVVRLTRKMKRRGCSTRSRALKCRTMGSTLSRMRANLKRLRTEVRRRGGSAKGSVTAIRSKMRRLGCGRSRRAVATDSVRTASIARKKKIEHARRLRKVRAVKRTRRNRKAAGNLRRAERSVPASQVRTVALSAPVRKVRPTSRIATTARTYCVRTCDGYFFPVTPSSSAIAGASMAAPCEALCPGQSMQLFIRPPGTEPGEAMISLADGRPYDALATAFDYRKAFRSQCACGRADPLAGRPVKAVTRQEPERPNVAVPRFRVPFGSDPERVALQRAETDVGSLVSVARNGLRGAQERFAGNRRVRVVGESFLPGR